MSNFGEPLSRRELEVLECVSSGASNKEIAAQLTISQNTVKVHLRNIFTKLGVSSRTEATTVAIQQGVLQITNESVPETVSQPISAPELTDDFVAAADEIEQTGSPSQEEGIKPDPVIEFVPPEVETAVPKRRIWLTRQTAILSVLLLLIGILTGLMIWQNNRSLDPTVDLFEEIPIGETGWFQNRPMRNGQAGMAVAAVGLNVYQIGGDTADGVVDMVHVYDTVGHLWHEATNKPTAVSDVTAAVLFGEIYVPGGRLADGQATDIVEAYSPANDAWRSVPPLPQPVAGGLTLSDGSFIYLFGGWDEEHYLNTAYVYDVGADGWRPLPAMPHARAFAAGSAVTGQLYVVGGYDGQTEMTTCQFFDPTTMMWFDCPDMLSPRGWAGAAVVLNKLYVFGGGSNKNEITFSEVYDPNNETWQVVNTPMLNETQAWTHLGVTNVEVRIFALGGRRAEVLLSDNLVYAPPVYKTFIPSASSGSNE